MRRTLNIFLLACLVVLAGCGFQLRGQAQFPFASAFVEAPDASALAPLLRQALNAQGKLAAQAQGAPVRISLAGEQREKQILSLSGGGKVREYRLVYKVGMKVTDERGTELMAPAVLSQVREITYDDTLILAKQAEEDRLNRAMEQEALRQALRRLSHVKH